jgi:hypothetical protein
MTHSSGPEGQDDVANHTDGTQNTTSDSFGTEAENPPSPPEHNYVVNNSNHMPSWRDRHIVVQLLIFVVTIAIATIYRGQLKEMVESNRISRESLQSVQRSYVNFAGITASVGLTSPDEKKRIGQMLNLNWVNSGNTPAKRAVTLGNFQAWRGNLPSEFDFHDIDKSVPPVRAILAPHDVLPVQIAIPIDNFRAQRSGTDRISTTQPTIFLGTRSPATSTTVMTRIVEITQK